MKSAIQDVQTFVTLNLNEKRKTEPDPVEAPPVEETAEVSTEEGTEGEAGATAAAPSGSGASGSLSSGRVPVGLPTNKGDAYLQVAAAAEFLRSQEPASHVRNLR